MRFSAVLVAVVVLAFVATSARAETNGDDLPNIIRLVQPLAHAQDLLRLPGLPRLLDGPFRRSVGESPPVAKLQAALATTAPLWPREITVAMPTSGFARLGGLGRAFILAALCKGATGAGARGRKELPPLQKALATELRGIRPPTLVVWAAFADAASARVAAATIADAMGGLVAETPTRVVSEGDAVGMRLRLGAFLPAQEMKAVLLSLGWISSPRDPQAKLLGAALASVAAEAWVVAEGTNVVLTVGPRYKGKAPIAGAPAVPVAAGQLVAAGRAEIGPLRGLVADWRALWAKWQGGAAAARARADDDTDILGDLPRMAHELQRWGERYEGWLWVDRGLHGLYRELGAPASTPLTSEPVARLLPAAALAIDIDTRDNLGERLSGAFSRVEDRLARRSLAEVAHDGDQPGEAERIELAYYKNFARLRELVHDKGPSLFAGGSALVVGAGSRIGRLEVRDRPGASPRTYKEVAVPELAWIGRAADSKAAVGFVADAWSAFGTAVGAMVASAIPPPKVVPAATLTDAPPPSPGASARWLDTSWFDALVQGQVSSDGGFKPQIAVQGDTVVLSTSPALTRQILSLGASVPAKGRLTLPPSRAPLVAWARYPCAPLLTQVRAAFAASETVAGRALNFGPPSAPKTAKDLTSLFALPCEIVDVATIATVQESGIATTTLEMPATAAIYRAGRK